MTDAVLDNRESHGRMVNLYFERDQIQAEVQRALGEILSETIRAQGR